MKRSRRSASLGGGRLPPALLARAAERFAALAEPNRLALLQVICEGEASVQRLADETGLGHSSASRHLAALAAQGFVVRRRQGTSAIYALADDTPVELCGLICSHLAKEAERTSALAAPRRRAAARARR
jgi:DNA-binding transcriptional ArsR family regulator